MKPNIVYDFLRPKKAEDLKQALELKFDHIDNMEVRVEKNATVLPLRPDSSVEFGKGGVVDSDNNYIEISGIKETVYGSYDYSSPAVYKDETVVYLGYLRKHWGHFLVESAARLWYVLDDIGGIDKYIFFIDENDDWSLSGNYKEFLSLTGILDKVELINEPTTYKCVYIPDRAFKRYDFYSDKYKDIFSKIRKNALDKRLNLTPHSKIFLSRTHIKNIMKSEIGSDLIDDFFERNGFYIIHPQEISLAELIFYMCSADEVASISGSISHNILFAKDHAKITVIERNVNNNDFQFYISIMKALNSTHVDATNPIYIVNQGIGPCIFGYNAYLQSFADKNNYLPPSDKYLTDKYKRKCLKTYMRTYKNFYSYQWYMPEIYYDFIEVLHEAYKDGFNEYREYLNGTRLFTLHDIFSPIGIHFIRRTLSPFHPKKIIKRILGM